MASNLQKHIHGNPRITIKPDPIKKTGSATDQLVCHGPTAVLFYTYPFILSLTSLLILPYNIMVEVIKTLRLR